MAADDQTLYFSSNGYSGFGGSDSIGELYGRRSEATGYISESQNLDLRNIEGDAKEILQKNLKLVPVEEKAIITLHNVFFNIEKAVLCTESKSELNRISAILSAKSSMLIRNSRSYRYDRVGGV